MADKTKILEVLDARSGKFTETTVDHPETFEEVAPYPRDRYGNFTLDPLRVDRELTEASTGGLTVANFPDMLRMGIQFDVFSGFNETPTVYERLVRVIRSNKQQEEYLDDEGIGLPPVVAEGQEYPEVSPTLGGGLTITNHKRGYIIHVTDEAQRFDQIGKVRDTANQMGRSMRFGREQSVMNVLTTTTNYDRLDNNDTGDDNQRTLTFSPVNLNLALTVMRTQKDRASGQYIGVSPDTLVCGPLLERFVRMLLGSPELHRVGGNTTNDVYGGGTNNPFFGTIRQIIVSPMFGASYQWALLDTRKALYFQVVEDIGVFTEGGNMTSESWIRRDTIRYKVRDWYGVGLRDDRFAFYSDSTTAPIVD